MVDTRKPGCQTHFYSFRGKKVRSNIVQHTRNFIYFFI